MRIDYIGNFGVSFSTESHIALSLEALGHEVVRHQENHLDWRFVPTHAKAAGSGLILWTHTHGYADETKHDACWFMLDGARRLGIPTASYHLDRWWGLEREHQARDEPFFRTDVLCTADGGHDEQWAALGLNHHWFPPAIVHTEVGRGTPDSRYRKDIGFVGSWRDYGHAAVWPWRFGLVAHLHRRYGSRFRAWPRGGRPSIRERELANLYASVKVVVGDSCLAGGATHYWSDRIPETIGRGGFLLHPNVDGLDEHFPKPLLPWRFTIDDLSSVDTAIETALSLPAESRESLIDDSMEHVRQHHTYKVRMRRLLELVEATTR